VRKHRPKTKAPTFFPGVFSGDIFFIIFLEFAQKTGHNYRAFTGKRFRTFGSVSSSRRGAI
jgi:hypothetical protein